MRLKGVVPAPGLAVVREVGFGAMRERRRRASGWDSWGEEVLGPGVEVLVVMVKAGA